MVDNKNKLNKDKLEMNKFGINKEEMADAGLYFGHRTSKVNPKIKPYLSGVRNGVNIFDLDKTVEKFQQALEFVEKLISENKVLIIIGTKIQNKDLVKEFAEECGLLYINQRWLGGTFTNFKTIKKRISYFKDLEDKRKKGEFDKNTKLERLRIDKELKDLEIKFGGIKEISNLPDAIFVMDMKKDALAVKEARVKGVKVIGVADSNIDPTLADYPIPANDDAMSSIRYILNKTKEVVLNSKPKV
jgi:small subunit ribosomal protein S2